MIKFCFGDDNNKKMQNFLKITNSTGCLICLKISGRLDLYLMNNFTNIKFALNALVSDIYTSQKLHFTPYVLFFAKLVSLVGGLGHWTQFLY